MREEIEEIIEDIISWDFEDNTFNWDEESEECCGHCGKAFDEFGDLGCEYCDVRSA